jgi:nicotinate-nucleotide adenylyltransferase
MLAVYALATLPVDEVLVVPVFEHAFNKRLAPFEDRVRMCELAFAFVPKLRVSRIEQGLPTPNRTLHTLQLLQSQEPDAELRLLVGSDVLADAHKWHAFDEVERLAPLLVVARPGYPHPGAVVLPDVSSTAVRELFAEEGSAALAKLAALLPKPVLEHALTHGLYREMVR